MPGEVDAPGQLAQTTDRVAQQWSKGNFGARMYDFIVMHERLSGLLGRFMWHNRMDDLYAEVAALSRLREESEILDVPCGGGVAFRGLGTDRHARYSAADVSPFMLDRARAEAARRGLREIDFVNADVTRLPFDDAAFDLCLSFNGLHCFPDPGLAVTEMVRVLRPGGSLRGTAVVSGAGRIPALCVAIFQRAGQFGTVGTAEDVEQWLAEAGIAEPEVTRRGAYVFFSGTKGSDAETAPRVDGGDDA